MNLPERSGPLLCVAGLRKEFGRVVALEGLDLRLEEPGVYGFLGPNGAGKTTTFKLVAGLLRPCAGRVLIGGWDVHRNPRRALSILGVHFDAPAFYPYLSGRDNLRVISRWLGLSHEKRIDELLGLVSLSSDADRKVQEYSWGMKQRLGLAATLLSDPPLLLLDEPTNGLDPAGIADIRRLLPQMAHEERRVVVLSSHRMDEVQAICDHVTIINRGAIVGAGRPAELASDSAVVEIRCEPIEHALEVLRAAEPAARIVRTGGRHVEVTGTTQPVAQLNRLLIEAGVAVEEIAERRESLEEIFFRLTGGGADA